MKVLYYTARNMSDPYSGIGMKITTQVNTLKKRGYDVDFAYREQDSSLIMERGGKKIVITDGLRRPYKVSASKYLRMWLQENNVVYDAVYIRYVYEDGQFHKLLRHLKQGGARVVVEIPTYPYDAELKDNMENRIVLLLDKLYRRRMKRYVDRIVTYSDDAEVFGIPAINTKNGIDFDSIPLVRRQGQGGAIHLVAVAALMNWHGYDRIINSMGAYYKNGGARELVFHLVGDGDEAQALKELARQNGLNGRVVFHGYQKGEALDITYAQADIALDLFGAHRKGTTRSSSLKTREYAARGLPVVAACEMDIFPQDWRYQLLFPADESLLELEKVTAFYDGIAAEQQSGVDVRQAIRDYAQQRVSMEQTFHDVFAFIEQ